MASSAASSQAAAGMIGSQLGPDDDRLKNAVAFLQHPKVTNAPLQQKVSFLQTKGLSKEEICRAFRQIDPNSPDAVAIENGSVDMTASQTRSSPTPSKPAASVLQTPSVPMYQPQQPMPMVYYPYVPQTAPPLQTSSSRLPLYTALASVVFAVGSGFAYFYRYAIAEKIVANRDAKVKGSVKDAVQEMARANQAAIESLQESSKNIQEMLGKLTSRIEMLSANTQVKTEPAPLSSISDRPGSLSPAVQALLEGTPTNPSPQTTSFDFAAADAALSQALSELEKSPEATPAISVLKIYIKNLVETGSESTRYHRISVASPTYEQKVAPYPSALALLKAVGFRRNDGFLIWQAPLGGPNSQDSIWRKQILTIALEKLTELVEKIEFREDEAA